MKNLFITFLRLIGYSKKNKSTELEELVDEQITDSAEEPKQKKYKVIAVIHEYDTEIEALTKMTELNAKRNKNGTKYLMS